MTSEQTIIKETMLIAGAISFLPGFLAGTIFTASKQQEATVNEQVISITALGRRRCRKIVPRWGWTTRLANLYFNTNQVNKTIEAYCRALAILPANADILTDPGKVSRKE